ncbi:flagellar hook protein FlgE [Porticoccus sp. W117]|uniref:flagellar hook protein FlgE n=1 Tax=Porticoccus sp. W117 TaxID=3054777 RepID=UPI00259780F9|nr:flagellar hook protein FlgE [Porticoccus sp. W117]MDM3871022.1 flagellar hook protein FlgE [Porticoccus sp. W117]
MAFDTAVSGLQSASAELGVIGNNIANSATTGFKTSRAEFSDLYASGLLGSGSNAIGRGVSLSAVSQQFTQGNISFTENSLDVAINGNGFFILNDSGTEVFTRAGQFGIDRDGFVVNNEGLRLQAFQSDTAGAILPSIGDLQLDTGLIEPQATTQAEIVSNLDSRESVPVTAWGGPFDAFATPPTAPTADMYNNSTSTTVFDSLGNPHILSTYYVKSATANQWQAYTLVDGVSTSGPETLQFDQAGALDPSGGVTSLTITGWAPLNSDGTPSGALAQNFTVDVSQTTQFGSNFAVSNINQNGFTSGQLRGVEIDPTGVVFAQYNNGQSRALGQVVLAGFSNTQGLQPQGGSIWTETFSSGPPTRNPAGDGGLGVLQSGALEDSNVEVTEQLVAMIVAQRNFQANAQVIQTEDAVTQAVINLR